LGAGTRSLQSRFFHVIWQYSKPQQQQRLNVQYVYKGEIGEREREWAR
jgi:hypothetical protein